MNKKGVSAVVTTSFFIMIALVLALIIYNFSSGFLKSRQSEVEGHSFYYDAKIDYVELPSTFVLGGGGPTEIEIGVERTDNEGNVSGLLFLFEGQGKSYSYETDPPNEVGKVTYYKIESSDLGITDFSEVSKVSIQLLYGPGNPSKILDEYVL